MSAEKENLLALEKRETTHDSWKMRNLLHQSFPMEEFSSMRIIRMVPSKENGFCSAVISGKSIKGSMFHSFILTRNASAVKSGIEQNREIKYEHGTFVDGQHSSLLKYFIPRLLKLTTLDSPSYKNVSAIALQPFAPEISNSQPTSVGKEKSSQPGNQELEAFDEAATPDGSPVKNRRMSLSPGSPVQDSSDDTFDSSKTSFCKVVGCVSCSHRDNRKSGSSLKIPQLMAFDQVSASYHTDKCFSSAFQIHDVFANFRNEPLSGTTKDLLDVRCKLFQVMSKINESRKVSYLLGLRKYPFEEMGQGDGQKPSKMSTSYMNQINHRALFV